MIRVTLELLPGGNASKARHLGTAEIANDGTGTAAKGNYTIRLSKWGRPNETWRRGALSGFDRHRDGPWDLLCMLLAAALEDRLRRMKARHG